RVTARRFGVGDAGERVPALDGCLGGGGSRFVSGAHVGGGTVGTAPLIGLPEQIGRPPRLRDARLRRLWNQDVHPVRGGDHHAAVAIREVTARQPLQRARRGDNLSV